MITFKTKNGRDFDMFIFDKMFPNILAMCADRYLNQG